MGAAVLGWACLGLAIVWAVGATISGLRTRKRFRVRPLDPEDVKPMPEGGDTYNVRSDYGTAIGKRGTVSLMTTADAVVDNNLDNLPNCS